MRTEHLIYEIEDDQWYDVSCGSPMVLHATFGNPRSTPVEVLEELFGLIQDLGLDVKRVVVPTTWIPHLPVEEGFLWGAWVAEPEPGSPPLVATSNYREGKPIRTVTVRWGD